MPMPEYGQNFVKPQSGGTGSWMAKLFGGVSDDKRARQMAQIQYDLHTAKGTFDTGEQGTRAQQKAAAEAAGKVYVGDRGFSREKKRAKFYKSEGIELKNMASSSADSLTMQKKATFDYGNGNNSANTVDVDGSTNGNLPGGGGQKPRKPRKPRAKKETGGTIAATIGAVKSGNVDFTQATGGEFGSERGISPKTAADFGAHVAGGGDQDSYLNQFSASGRRKRTKPNTPPPPSGSDGNMPSKKNGNTKKTSTGGGLTEIRNSKIETGNRSTK